MAQKAHPDPKSFSINNAPPVECKTPKSNSKGKPIASEGHRASRVGRFSYYALSKPKGSSRYAEADIRRGGR